MMHSIFTVTNNQNKEGGLNLDRTFLAHGKDHHFYALFDGHKGEIAANYISKELYENVTAFPNFPSCDLQEACINGFLTADVNFINHVFGLGKITVDVEGEEVDITSTIRDSGCTGVCALIVGDTLVVASVGDSRLVIGTNDGSATQLTADHSTRNVAEVERAEKLGASVSRRRLFSSLLVTRAFGDAMFKLTREERMAKASKPAAYLENPKNSSAPLTALPQVSLIGLEPKHEFLLLASDGLFDFLSNEKVAEIITQGLREGKAQLDSSNLNVEERKTKAQQIIDRLCKSVVDAAIQAAEDDDERHDDITALLVLCHEL